MKLIKMICNCSNRKMKWEELKKLVISEYDKRNLASDVRYRSLDRIEAKKDSLKKRTVGVDSNRFIRK